MQITIIPDGDGFLAKVKDKFLDTFAWGKTEEEAIKELIGVVDSLMDIRLEEVEHARKARKKLLQKSPLYAV